MIELIINAMFQSLELFVGIAMLIATTVIALFAIRISKSQLNVQKLQLKHDLYERRYEIYKKLKSEYRDYEDNFSLINNLKDRYFGIKAWLNENEDHMSFLFEESVLEKAKKLMKELSLAETEYNKIDPDKDVVKKINDLYNDLKSDISSVLSFKNLM